MVTLPLPRQSPVPDWEGALLALPLVVCLLNLGAPYLYHALATLERHDSPVLEVYVAICRWVPGPAGASGRPLPQAPALSPAPLASAGTSSSRWSPWGSFATTGWAAGWPLCRTRCGRGAALQAGGGPWAGRGGGAGGPADLDPPQCWEDFVGQELYRLVVLDFLFALLDTLCGELVWR